MGYCPSRTRARDLLSKRLLGRGCVAREEIVQLADEAEIPLRTLQRCAQELGVEFCASGGVSYWRLDELPPPPVPMEILSLGAGVQSTTLALLACEGVLHLDAAIFADTGWEPPGVYRHLDRLQAHMEKAGIPLYRVGAGNIRHDCLDPNKRFVSLPYYTKSTDGRLGIGRRQCTNEYKIRPIHRKVRELLGAKPPTYRAVPRNSAVNQWIGFSTDEIYRVTTTKDNWYTTKRYPLLELDMSRADCQRWLAERGWKVAKSACVGCPFHSNNEWRDMRDNRPDEWADAVAFDQAIRKGGHRAKPLDGEAFLHPSRVPLAEADLTNSRWDGDPDGCSPYGCRSGRPIAGTL